MLRRADSESDRTLANTVVPGSHSLMATSKAKASQVVLWTESPVLAWKRRRSHAARGEAHHHQFVPLESHSNKTPRARVCSDVGALLRQLLYQGESSDKRTVSAPKQSQSPIQGHCDLPGVDEVAR